MMFTKKNRVLFIIHDVYQDFNLFPLGPAYLAAVLDKEGAYVESYCMDVFHYTNEELSIFLEANTFDLICLGFLAARFTETIGPLCKVINKYKKNAWFILGGHGPSPIPEYILQETKADIVAIGEAENTIIDLLNCKINNLDLNKISGIAYRKNDKYYISKFSAKTKDLDSIPFPLYKIFPMEKYIHTTWWKKRAKNEKFFNIISSRGCFGKCNFCYRLENGIRLRSVQNVISEIKFLKEEYGVDNIFFVDELFLINKKRLLEFEAEVKRNKLVFSFFCAARADIINDEIVSILKRCGCVYISIGFESSSDEVLQRMNKNITAEQNLKALECIKKEPDIEVSLNFIWNNFGDNERSLMENVKLIKKYNSYMQCRTIRPVTPYPGSPLFEELINNGRLKNVEDFFKRFNNSDLILVNLMDMTDDDAYRLLFKANKELIEDHYKNTSGNMEEAQKIINGFKELYENPNTVFRGSRQYDGTKK